MHEKKKMLSFLVDLKLGMSHRIQEYEIVSWKDPLYLEGGGQGVKCL